MEDSDVDYVDRCRGIVYFIEDPDVARVQPTDAGETPRHRPRRVRLISQ
jgi:hypothetical protein